MDVKDSRNGIVLADDFLCTNSGPITDIHIWGSWLNDIHGLVTNFWIGIYSDVPAVIGPVGQIPSHPGTLLWWTNFPQGQYAETINEPPGEEYFYNPTNNTIMGGDTQAWYYCFYPAQPFIQQGTANNPTNYWLAVRAQLDSQTTQVFGWKNSVSKYNDAAVWGTVDVSGLPSGNWQSMTNPITQQQMDLSFKLTTPTNTPPPIQCVETNGVKTVQGPNILGGYDVWNTPYVLADDFVCNFRGPITDIHLWGSWLADQSLTGTITFWLGIYDDVPAGPGNTFSQPGTNLLWQQWFAPGQYAETIWTANALGGNFLTRARQTSSAVILLFGIFVSIRPTPLPSWELQPRPKPTGWRPMPSCRSESASSTAGKPRPMCCTTSVFTPSGLEPRRLTIRAGRRRPGNPPQAARQCRWIWRSS